MILLINDLIPKFFVDLNEKLDSDYLAMSELTREINSIVKNSLDDGNENLTSSDIEHILKITSDVTHRIKYQTQKLTNMNFCNEQHVPMYKIKYKITHNDKIPNECLVCEKCFGKQEFFGTSDEIESIISLRNYLKIRLEIDHLSIMTREVSKKLKNNLN